MVMRPTRWTRKQRVTFPGCGGWIFAWDYVTYINPQTGHGVTSHPQGRARLPRAFIKCLLMRRAQEREVRRQRLFAEGRARMWGAE
jgi:hypothetical protein